MNRDTQNSHLGYHDTPIFMDSGYRVHDGTRPQPPAVRFSGPSNIPSDAIVLLDGSSLSEWIGVNGNEPGWELADGILTVVPGSGNIQTRRDLGNGQLHIDFRCPEAVSGSGQGRGNSGIFFLGLYEVQILDSYENPTYADGTIGAIYGQFPPLANPILPPGIWNTMDVIWQGPVFENGILISRALITVLLNGIVLHHARALHGPTKHKELASYVVHPPTGPLMLQDHGARVSYRNIWFRNLNL